MEKLSSILATSPRVQSVDMTDAPPVRPGVATYGRPVGANNISDRVVVSQRAKDLAFKDTMGGMSAKEAGGVKIAEDLSRKFFEARVKPTVNPADEAQSREIELMDERPAGQVPTKMALALQAVQTEAPGKNMDLEA